MTRQKSSLQWRTTFALASIYAFRMLGLFMILPIFSLYLPKLDYANATLVGLALGIYGLTQATLQIPFAMCSDRIGRKPVIIFGLILFVLGSIIAAVSHSIYGIIIGRAIQGAGAIGSTLIALLADTTDEKHRLRAMTVVGMTIGFSFIVAMILGPVFNNLIGLSGIFWLTALLASAGILILLFLVPTPATHLPHPECEPVLGQFKNVLKHSELVRLNYGIFSLHAILMALFVVLPITLATNANLLPHEQWEFYLPILLLAAVAMMPFVMIAEKKQLVKPLFISAIILLTLTQPLLWLFGDNIKVIGLLLWLFFTAFTFLEACLPSLVTKFAPPGSKGTAAGIYSSSQFLGIFIGGSVGGLLYNHFGTLGIFLFSMTLGVVWALLAFSMKQPNEA